MGELIDLAAHRAVRQHGCEIPQHQHRPGVPRRATFYFDLSSPFTYLAIERVERLFPVVRWRPVLSDALHGGALWADEAQRGAAMASAEERARAMRLPLVWPERFPLEARAAMRVAAQAVREGRAGAFALAAARLAFCGGFDLDEPEILAEAAAAAGISLDDCAAAALDVARDAQIERVGRALIGAGADRLPGLRIGRALYWGERRAGDAVAAVRYARVAQL